jgi:hypothetical protein
MGGGGLGKDIKMKAGLEGELLLGAGVTLTTPPGICQALNGKFNISWNPW